MLAKLRSHFTYANVVSSVCLFIVLGGTSYAVATGSIDSREIKNNTVRSKDIRNNDVRGGDVRNGTIRGIDVGNESLTGSDIAESTLGVIPKASHANSSDSASRAELSQSAAEAARAISVDSVKVASQRAAPGETKQVATDGPLTLQMRCIDNGGGDIGVVLEMDSSANSAAINASFSGADADVLNANDPPANIAGDSGTSQAITQAGWAALTPSGGLFQGYGMVASKFGGGNNCMAKLVLIG